VFDMKEQGPPSACDLVRRPAGPPAARVATALHACLARPAKMIGTTRLKGASMFVRRLSPQEDKLDLTRLRGDELDGLVRYLGALVGAAHRRGATSVPREPWTRAERAGVVERAILLAGAHEAAYLALCDLARAER
jgi:hypothetical protein